MSATKQRDQVCVLAKTNSPRSLDLARKISEPWYRAQALAWVARFSANNSERIAAEAICAAAECDDSYKNAAVRAWPIAVLAERDYTKNARQSLKEALQLAEQVEPISSRSEALMTLMAAAAKISHDDARKVYEILKKKCPAEEHWRCQRALTEAEKMMAGELPLRSFFW
jgi:hypothetical protein